MVGSYDDSTTYSEYPTEVNKYECRTGPFEGFFVSSVEFCKHVINSIKIMIEKIIIKQEHKVHLVHKVHQVHMEPMATDGAQGSTRSKRTTRTTMVYKVKPRFNGTQGPPGPSGVVNVSNAYVVWDDNTPGNSEIFFSASQGLGTINVSNDTGNSVNPQIATSGNNVYVTWVDDTPGNVDIFFAASNNNGTSFWYANKLEQQYWHISSPFSFHK